MFSSQGARLGPKLSHIRPTIVKKNKTRHFVQVWSPLWVISSRCWWEQNTYQLGVPFQAPGYFPYHHLPLDRCWGYCRRYQVVPPHRRFSTGLPPPPASSTPVKFPPPGHFPPVPLPTRPFSPGSYTRLRIQESTLLKGKLIPNIWTFLKVLQKEQALNEIQITQMMAGQQASPQRRQYRESGQRILRIVEDFENRTAMEYLRGIPHNLSF